MVGIGPGARENLTFKALSAIEKSDAIVGYKTYIDMVQYIISDKEIFTFGMTKEVDRCSRAIELASEGRHVSLISSGDAGVYGMAGLVFEILGKKMDSSSKFDIEVIPGVSTIQASAALLGAPLMHDFAVISLSDILTPWDLIERRIISAVKGNFVVVLLNPKSKKRIWQIERAREILIEFGGKDRPVGIVKNASREGEKVVITTLKDMTEFEIDMTTTIIIGNSDTYIYDNRIITPRIDIDRKKNK